MLATCGLRIVNAWVDVSCIILMRALIKRHFSYTLPMLNLNLPLVPSSLQFAEPTRCVALRTPRTAARHFAVPKDIAVNDWLWQPKIPEKGSSLAAGSMHIGSLFDDDTAPWKRPHRC